MLNVDNEVVEINATHLSFSGIGRQKPKTYVVNLEFFEPIDAENSSWSFGSVGTVKFVLQKAAAREWPRLTAGKESVKNHRVWWEKQEQVEKADRAEASGEGARAQVSGVIGQPRPLRSLRASLSSPLKRARDRAPGEMGSW